MSKECLQITDLISKKKRGKSLVELHQEDQAVKKPKPAMAGSISEVITINFS
jgi:hypothetical protein